MTKKQAANILKEIKKVATEASLTGALEDGGEMLAISYNSIRQKAIQEKWIEDEEIIPILDTESSISMGKVGCASALFMGILLDDSDF